MSDSKLDLMPQVATIACIRDGSTLRTADGSALTARMQVNVEQYHHHGVCARFQGSLRRNSTPNLSLGKTPMPDGRSREVLRCAAGDGLHYFAPGPREITLLAT
ncbi:MAG TPA: hypothetical protein VG713_01415, partial [Pirellulales bacterium]|nr:hypothetical protein [Pirellulales bacterium]